MHETLLTEFELAERFAASVGTIRKDRQTGAGHFPKFVKLGNSVRYRESDVEAFLASRQTFAFTPTRRINRKSKAMEDAV